MAEAAKRGDAEQYFVEGNKILKKTNPGPNQEELEKAGQLFSDAIQQNNNRAKYWAARGRSVMMQGNYHRATFDFTVAIKLEGHIASHYHNRGQCYQKHGRFEEALGDYSEAVLIDSHNAKYLNDRGQMYAKMKKWEEAIEDFTKAIQYSSEAWKIFQARGQAYREIGKLQQSISDLQKAVELKPTDPSIRNNLGKSLFDDRQFDKALAEYSIAISNGSNPDYYKNRGVTYQHLGFFKKALEDLNSAINQDASDAGYWFDRGNVYLALNDQDKALENFSKAMELAPSEAMYAHSKGLAYEKKLQYEDAISMYQHALNLKESHIASIYHMGLMYQEIVQYNKALENLTTVLELAGPHQETYEARGKIFQDMRDHKSAIQDFTSAIKLLPSLNAYYHRGVSKLELLDLEGAIADLRKAQEFDPICAKVFHGLGLTYHAMKDAEYAKNYLNNALSNDPENIQFLVDRSRILSDLSDYEDAIQDLSKALEIAPEDPNLHYKIGLVYFINGQYENCIDSLQNAITFNPFPAYESDIFFHLGLAFANLEMYDSTITPLSKCIVIQPKEAEYYHERAKAYQMMEQWELSLIDFNKVIELQPNNARAYFRRAFSFKALEQYVDASKDLEKAKELDPNDPRLIVNIKKTFDIKWIVLCKPGQEERYSQVNLP